MQRAIIYADLAASDPVVRQTASSVDFKVDAQMLAGAITAVALTGNPQLTVSIDWPIEAQSAVLANAVSAAVMNYRSSAIDGVSGESSYVELFVSDPAVGTQTLTESATTAVVLGLTLGLALGLGLAFLRYFLDRRLRTPREAEDLTGLNLVASLPLGVQANRRQKPASEAMLADSFRRIRAVVLERMKAPGARNILITSTQEAENAVDVAIYLASSIAETGMRVLLVDADLCDRNVGAHFGFDDNGGLVDLVTGAASLEDLLHHVGTSSLSVLTAGAKTDDGSDFMSHGAVLKKLSELTSEFEVTVIAAPPVLARSDTLSLLPAADAVLLVAGVGVVHRQELVQAVRTLEQLGKLPVGFVATGAA
ncbi:CpsD/CapB family tyrosine-protein kinase [Cryobacterium sp. Hh38]|uniref:polysaccharide biosynthesis tyrosine autokinase n=1 Tax=Cryobacterium sp. Hh38 TaxID=1259156 RepID=UPI001068FF83|nr:CpsD/CapB family tyrosine-protein kinase [Cryobacterium sp. Hh38]TFD57543.1 tyrosine-protein kinase family protein [Cryobacterium sp. Hh38]